MEVREGQVVARIRETALDFAECQRLRTELTHLVADKGRVTIDLSSVHYADVFGFELLLAAVKDCPGLVRYRGVRPPLASLFLLSHLGNLILDEHDEA